MWFVYVILLLSLSNLSYSQQIIMNSRLHTFLQIPPYKENTSASSEMQKGKLIEKEVSNSQNSMKFHKIDKFSTLSLK